MNEHSNGQEDPTDAELVLRLRSPKREVRDRAMDALHERYAERLKRVIAARLGSQLRRKVGVSDVVQSAFMVLMRPSLKPRGDDMWRLLVRIARLKCAARHEHYTAARRSMRRETPIEDSEALRNQAELMIGFDPQPRMVAAGSIADSTEEIIETVLGLMKASTRLKPSLKAFLELYVRCGELRLPEIAQKLSISQRTAESHMMTIRGIFCRLAGQCPSCHRQAAGIPHGETICCESCGHHWPKEVESTAKSIAIEIS
ncbi:MAG: hypothetical protein JNJ88_14975 [Planctomycetes bacterium]|nr:hypothetical protein [Planctomycetota bacterium]